MVPGWSLTKIVQMVLIGCISRSRVENGLHRYGMLETPPPQIWYVDPYCMLYSAPRCRPPPCTATTGARCTATARSPTATPPTTTAPTTATASSTTGQTLNQLVQFNIFMRFKTLEVFGHPIFSSESRIFRISFR